MSIFNSFAALASEAGLELVHEGTVTITTNSTSSSGGTAGTISNSYEFQNKQIFFIAENGATNNGRYVQSYEICSNIANSTTTTNIYSMSTPILYGTRRRNSSGTVNEWAGGYISSVGSYPTGVFIQTIGGTITIGYRGTSTYSVVGTWHYKIYAFTPSDYIE